MRLSLLALALFLGGCMTQPYKAAPGAGAKKFAVVSIIANDEIAGAPAYEMTLSGLVKAALSEDADLSQSSEQVLREALPMIEKAFAAQRLIPILSPDKVKSNAAFRNASGDEPEVGFLWMKGRFNVAPGYKFFKSKEGLVELARQMDVDGVIGVNVLYRVLENKVGGLGLAAGTHRAGVTLTAYAIDREGNVVWRDSFKGKAKESIGFFGDAVNFTKMRPGWSEAMQGALAEMNRELAGG